MISKFKAIVIDVDGTITHPDRSINCDAVELMRTLKVPIILATGNIYCYARAASKLIGLEGAVIAENGGIYSTSYDAKPKITLNAIAECKKALEYLKKHIHLSLLDSGDRKTEIALRRDFDVDYAKKILSSTNYDVEIVDTNYAIHIKNKNINKGTGLLNLSKELNLNLKDFIAIGDSENDREMLQSAGFSIALANADKLTKEKADIVTTSSYGDGAIEAIQYLLDKSMIDKS
ncbi:phosphoglycolate phosphatase [Methanosalsum natronophilum]|uniref:phosphoglycolate phosphatase n=1 Tax=Methanosalsum natronophilum TaxID=768733 RepID=UPI002166E0A4|nr:phosphoglycolate phosphatase [Methanosalsum natronophilum]MCS3923982.1 phosphoglycolate phosphatase (TIGR01487 family) [Methanosalsum natronophilum]